MRNLIKIIIVGFCLAARVAIAAADDVTPNRRWAAKLFNSVTGSAIGIDDARAIAMEKLLDAGKEREAVHLAVNDPAFIDQRMYQFARRVYTTTESYNASNNDFISTLVGIARDNTDAREMLTGNYYYEFDISDLNEDNKRRFGTVIPGVGQPNNLHYDSAFRLQYSMSAKLKKTSPQMVFRDTASPDAAGLLTSNTYLVNNTQSGTNRRLVEYTFRSFMCVDMLDWMDATRPDDKVGRDVDRFAGGGNTRYQTTCKGCHAQMDAFRPAFAFAGTNSRTPYVGTTVNRSLANNKQIFPAGYEVKDSNWYNYATGALNMDRFGWRGDYKSGTGMHAFGTMISNSKGFSRCMTKRMFAEICKRDPLPYEETIVRGLADEFEKTYKLRDLAELVAINNVCLPKGAR